MKSDFLNKLGHIIRQRWRISLVAIIVMLVIVGMINHAGRAVPSILPETAAVQRVDIAKFVHATGQLQPIVKVEIGAQVSGQVRQLHVQLGQAVKQGTLLVSLDSDSGRNAVQQAEAALAQQVAITKRSFIELQAARREAERQTRLLAGDATTSLDREKADTELAKADAEHDAQQASLAQKRADLIDKQLKLTFTRVPSPIDGEVVSIAVQEGQTVNSLQTAPTLLTLAQLSRMTVKTRVAESEIGLVRVGQAARVTTLAADSRTYEGHVRVLQPIPERIGNAMFYNVLFDIDNADRHLLSDMTVQVELAVVRVDQVLALPIVALGQRDSNGGYIVQVLDSAGKVSQRKIHIGTRDDARVQVLDGVQLGERVLLVPSPAALTKAPQ